MKAQLGFGGYFSNPIDNPENIIRYAYDIAGIRFFDTSPAYGESERHFGNALKDYPRESYTLSTKTKALELNAFHKSFINSISNLNTRYIDMYFGHSFIDDDETWESARRIMHEMQRLKSEGFIKLIGVSGHSVSAATDAINSGLIDVIMIPHSLMYRKFDGVIDLAKQMGIIVITMKNFASGILLGGPNDNEFKKEVTLQKIMDFTSFNNGDIIIPAYRSIEQLEEIWTAYKNINPLTFSEIKCLENKIVKILDKDFCRFCNECRPCKHYGWAMSQPGILKSKIYHEKFEINMKEQYFKYPYNINFCGDCDSQCSEACPFGIDIKSEMRLAHNLFVGECFK